MRGTALSFSQEGREFSTYGRFNVSFFLAFAAYWVQNLLRETTTSELAAYILKIAGYHNPNLVTGSTSLNKVAVLSFLCKDLFI